MFGHRKFAGILNGCSAAAVFAIVAIVSSGCTTQQSQSTLGVQTQSTQDPPIKDLPQVASLSDYMAEGTNGNPFMYAAAGQYDPLMTNPLWFQPYWYPVPVYYVYVPVQRHSPPPTIVAAITPPPRSVVASAAPREHFGGFGGRMGGMGFAHPGGLRR